MEGVCKDVNNKVCLVLGRSREAVRFIEMTNQPLEVASMRVKSFDERFQPIPYPVEKARQLFLKATELVRATPEAIEALGGSASATQLAAGPKQRKLTAAGWIRERLLAGEPDAAIIQSVVKEFAWPEPRAARATRDYKMQLIQKGHDFQGEP